MTISLGPLGLLGFLFVILKLTGAIAWWAVTCPFWLPLIVVLVFCVVAAVLTILEK